MKEKRSYTGAFLKPVLARRGAERRKGMDGGAGYCLHLLFQRSPCKISETRPGFTRFTLRGRGKGHAFIDMGDQFLALSETKTPHQDRHRHFGLVVDDRGEVKALAQAAGATLVDGQFLDFLDPWGNRIEVVGYADIQFSKAPHVLRGWRSMAQNPRGRDKSSPTRAWRCSGVARTRAIHHWLTIPPRYRKHSNSFRFVRAAEWRT